MSSFNRPPSVIDSSRLTGPDGTTESEKTDVGPKQSIAATMTSTKSVSTSSLKPPESPSINPDEGKVIYKTLDLADQAAVKAVWIRNGKPLPARLRPDEVQYAQDFWATAFHAIAGCKRNSLLQQHATAWPAVAVAQVKAFKRAGCSEKEVRAVVDNIKYTLTRFQATYVTTGVASETEIDELKNAL